MIFRALVALQVLLCLLRLDFAWGRVVNRTIDDTFGDSETQRLPLYLPRHVDKAFKNTYQAATYAPDSGKISITLAFNGTAIWVFFILANNEGDGITTITDVNFAMDGENTPTNFRHAPDLTTREPLYNQLVYNRTDMPFGTHALEFSPMQTSMSTSTSTTLSTHYRGSREPHPPSRHDDDPGTTTTRAQRLVALPPDLRPRARQELQAQMDPGQTPPLRHPQGPRLRPNPFIQENAFQRGPSSSGNEPLYSPVAVGMRNHSNGSPSMNSGAYSGSAIPYGGVARAEYDSDRATSVTGGVASIQGSMPSTYTQ
ncbi:hypothetical protein FA13DRAFT_1721327, partial [Coprinellus micaceus]